MSECERIKRGPSPDDKHPALGLCTVTLICRDSAVETLRRIREVLTAVLSQGVESDIDSWAGLLPRWFVDACVAEMTEAEKAEFLRLPVERRLEWGKKWSLADWLHWFRPSERQWEWWDGKVQSDRVAVIELAPCDIPFAWGALEWLCQCAGATEIKLGE